MGIIKDYLNQTYAEKTVFKTSIVSYSISYGQLLNYYLVL